MEAKELRIGNYFFDDENNISKCNGFSPFGHSVRCDEQEGCDVLLDYFQNGKWHTNYECDINDCRPIELTEQLLLKFGFEIKQGSVVWILKMPDHDATIQIWGDNKYASICRSGIAAYHFKCKYIHQLQNLYFALTSTELEINL